MEFVVRVAMRPDAVKWAAAVDGGWVLTDTWGEATFFDSEEDALAALGHGFTPDVAALGSVYSLTSGTQFFYLYATAAHDDEDHRQEDAKEQARAEAIAMGSGCFYTVVDDPTPQLTHLDEALVASGAAKAILVTFYGRPNYYGGDTGPPLAQRGGVVVKEEDVPVAARVVAAALARQVTAG